MKKVQITAVFNCDIEKVWNIVTDNSNYTWRTDLEKIVVSDNEEEFKEYSKGGYITDFKITKKDLFNKYEFDIENDNIKGNWVGEFSKLDNGMTQVIFTENIIAKKYILNLVLKIFLKKQQSKYISDLKNMLQEN